MSTNTTEPKVYKLKQRHELIQDVEGLDYENIQNEEGKQDDPKWWRRALYALNKKRQDLREFQEQKQLILDVWNKANNKRERGLASFEAFLQSQLKNSKYRTKTGGYKFDMAPDLGVISIHKPRTKFVKDEEFWKTQPEFVEEIFTTKLKNKDIDKYLAQFKIHEGHVIDNNGEVIPGVRVEYNPVFEYKESEL